MGIAENSFRRAKGPREEYYGTITRRAINDSTVSGSAFKKDFIKAYALVKLSAAIANAKVGSLDPKVSNAIVKACGELMSGKYNDQFSTGLFQEGAMTPANMSLNEAIADKALKILGYKKGNYRIVNPSNHVNMTQPTGDAFQSAVHIAAYSVMEEKLIPSLCRYQKAIEVKSRGGRRFSGYSIEKEISAIKNASHSLLSLNVGNPAASKDMNTYPEFKNLFFKEINLHIGYYFTPIENDSAMMQNLATIAQVSRSLMGVSSKLVKMANDLQIMPSASIKAGKINRSTAKKLSAVCLRVMGNDTSINTAAQAGQLEPNVFGYMAAYDLLESIDLLSNSVDLFTNRCIARIKPAKSK